VVDTLDVWTESLPEFGAEGPCCTDRPTGQLGICATYLTGAAGAKGSADPVARFHLSNGARLERVNWLGNLTPRGIEESCGIMVNYLNDPKAIEANHEAFAHDGMVVCSPEVDALIVAAAPPVGVAAVRPISG
jgi:malonyl-CoA decarboxylase